MIILDEKQQLAEQDRARSGLVEWELPPPLRDGPEGEDDELPPPSYDTVTRDDALDYVPCDVDALGNVSTSDPGVNRNPRLMLAFITQQASRPPPYCVRVRGSHTEHAQDPGRGRERGRQRSRGRDRGRTRGRRATPEPEPESDDLAEADESGSDDDDARTVVAFHQQRGRVPRRSHRREIAVTDFDFAIDLSSQLTLEPEFFVLHDSLAAYRGQPVLEVDSLHGRRPASSPEKARLSSRSGPWQLRSCGGTRPLSQWVAAYVACGAAVKAFEFARIVHGWDLAALETALRGAVAATLYSGTVDVTFVPATGSGVTVRSPPPSNALQALLQRAFGAHRFAVCGAAYAFKRWIHLRDSVPGEEVGEYIERTARAVAEGRLKQTADGISELVGAREGEWFAQWEATIQRCVRNRLRNRDPLLNPIQD